VAVTPPPTAEDIDTGALIRDLVDAGGLREFIRIFWSEAVPGTYCSNWHIDAVCEYLEAVTLGQITRLVINLPPGHMKSLSVGVFWPAWMWTLDPATSFMFGSFDQSLLNAKQSEPMISLINSYTYQAAYPYVQLASKKPALREFKTTQGGFRFNTSPTGKGTGRHVDHLVVDDPLKPGDAIGGHKAAFTKVDNWFDGTLPTRVRKSITLIMQRLHTDDLAGMCIARGYETLILPARQTKRPLWTPPAWCTVVDPRTEIGEPLWPERFPETKLRELEIGLKGEASAQLQQDPTPATGGIIEEPWTRLEWIDPPVKGTWVQSWDFSSKGTSESHSKCSGQLWCLTRDMKLAREFISDLNDRLAKVPGATQDARIIHLPDRAEMFVLVDRVGGHWNFVTSKAQFVLAQTRTGWARARIKLIEDKANGSALIQEYKSKFPGIVSVEPEGTKEERLRIHSEKFEAGQVIFPPGSNGDLVREQLVKFPRFSWDDEVDTCTQALDRLANKSQRYRENLRRIAGRG
jgi:predicted phage terminase large subunit-like protein